MQNVDAEKAQEETQIATMDSEAPMAPASIKAADRFALSDAKVRGEIEIIAAEPEDFNPELIEAHRQSVARVMQRRGYGSMPTAG